MLTLYLIVVCRQPDQGKESAALVLLYQSHPTWMKCKRDEKTIVCGYYAVNTLGQAATKFCLS